ncbi:MAG: nuclear transport factor 2 family protein [Humibacillus sp.]|nr:nuclear transport factor 2 family protein [Humibacillus sp.]MDN5778102.1 nuclear transport factor 2 family protein [Humibacillus sp.]
MTDPTPDSTTASTTLVTNDADPLQGEAARVWAVFTDLYAAYLEGDRDRLEAHLDAGCTMWDSTIPVLRTKEDLQAGRAHSEPAQGETGVADSPASETDLDPDPDPDYPAPVGLVASEPVVGLLGVGAAWETHLLAAHFDDASLDEQLRCTSVLRRDEGGIWRVVHHHEELLTGPGRPAPVRRRVEA